MARYSWWRHHLEVARLEQHHARRLGVAEPDPRAVVESGAGDHHHLAAAGGALIGADRVDLDGVAAAAEAAGLGSDGTLSLLPWSDLIQTVKSRRARFPLGVIS